MLQVANSNAVCQNWINYEANGDAAVTGAMSGDNNCIVYKPDPSISKCCTNGAGKYQAVGKYQIKCGHKVRRLLHVVCGFLDDCCLPRGRRRRRLL